ncbi:MAG: phosphoribosyltransferase family protein [Pseudomonadota bacterium]
MPHNLVCCGRCAAPLAAPASRCGRCHEWADRDLCVLAPLRYDFPLDQMIARLKYDGDLTILPALAQLLPARPPHWPDHQRAFIVPLPLHRRRQRVRGFNQAGLLAAALSKQWHWPLRRRWLVRQRDTEPQVSLRGDARQHNVADAFSARHHVHGKHVCIVDDVMTSGATVLAAAAALRAAGALTVRAVVLARAG